MGNASVQACRKVVKELRKVFPSFSPQTAQACDRHTAALVALVDAGVCGTSVPTLSEDALAACFIGTARDQLAAILAGTKIGTTSLPAHAGRLDLTPHAAALRVLAEAARQDNTQPMIHAARKGEINSAALLDLGLSHQKHIDPRYIDRVLIALGARGATILRLMMRYGRYYAPLNDLAAAFTLVDHHGDREAVAMLSSTAMAKPPAANQNVYPWYGRATRAMSFLLRVAPRVGVDRLATLVLNAPVFASSASPAKQIAAAQERLVGKKVRPYRVWFFDQLVELQGGREALQTRLEIQLSSSNPRLRQSAQALLKEIPDLKTSLPASAK